MKRNRPFWWSVAVPLTLAASLALAVGGGEGDGPDCDEDTNCEGEANPPPPKYIPEQPNIYPYVPRLRPRDFVPGPPPMPVYPPRQCHYNINDCRPDSNGEVSCTLIVVYFDCRN